ncbi:riboflavin biosynthesis pyrimidine reductase [Nakamurella sp. UYEF19]|uniref:pyrimidine reductase family protein n=1 Tax=Nakamurella sp. UYEF19 TaxID=1756392 RepID=UPI0033975758
MLRCHPDHLDSPDDDALAAAYAWPTDVGNRPVIRANMVAALDGGVAVDGKSADLGGPGDQRIFAILRDLADVLLVGAGTIRAEGYGGIRLDDERLARRHRWGLGTPPPLAVVTGGGLDRDLGIFTDSEIPPILITTTKGAARMTGYPATVVDAGVDSVDLTRMVAELSGLGFSRVLCEGGPSLLGRLIAADLLDELCLTTSPLTLGAGPTTLLGGVSLPAPARWRLDTLHLDEDHLFTRYARVAA